MGFLGLAGWENLWESLRLEEEMEGYWGGIGSRWTLFGARGREFGLLGLVKMDDLWFIVFVWLVVGVLFFVVGG